MLPLLQLQIYDFGHTLPPYTTAQLLLLSTYSICGTCIEEANTMTSVHKYKDWLQTVLYAVF